MEQEKDLSFSEAYIDQYLRRNAELGQQLAETAIVVNISNGLIPAININVQSLREAVPEIKRIVVSALQAAIAQALDGADNIVIHQKFK